MATTIRSQPDEQIPTDLTAIRDEEFGYEQARHLLLRAGFGGTPDQIQTLAAWGAKKSVDFLVDLESLPEPKADQDFDPNAARPFTPEEQAAYRRAQRSRDEDTLARLRLRRQQAQRADRSQMARIQKWWLERMIETPRPLEEKMTLFWHGHFATSYRTIENSYHMLQQNELFRANALGNFGDLLFGIIRDPAMIRYLNNDQSRAGAPNENLARELMELFSLGEGNYSENDIKEGARALTGYTYEGNSFVFNQTNHDQGSKSILGRAGNMDGDDFVVAILNQRSASTFMCQKLYDYFVQHWADVQSDEQASRRVQSFVSKLSDHMLRNRYEIKPVLRTLFMSKHFYHPTVMNRRIKSPAELVVGAVRTLRTPVRDLGALLEAMNLMGQNLFYPPSVAGWDGGRTWINTSTIFVRQNVMNFLLTGKLPRGFDAMAGEDRFDPWPLVEPMAEIDPASARDASKVIDYLLRFTVGSSPRHARATLESFAEQHGNVVRPDLVTGMLVLISAMPEYQLT